MFVKRSAFKLISAFEDLVFDDVTSPIFAAQVDPVGEEYNSLQAIIMCLQSFA